MNRYYIAVLGALLITAYSAQAKTITVDEAKSIARSWHLQNDVKKNTRSVRWTAEPEVLYTATESESAEPTLWVMSDNVAGGGYVVVAADDMAAAPVLGYSENGVFDADDMPDNLRYWLDSYSRQIEYVRTHPEASGVGYTRAFTEDVAALLTCNWNQSSPYYNQCPMLDGKRCVTGCVATAISQIMYYYRWPEEASGSGSYKWSKGNQTLTFDFTGLKFDWANMLDKYTTSSPTAACDAVAELMVSVGYACSMNYSSDASGAGIFTGAQALVNYFGYRQDVKNTRRDNTPLADFESEIASEIKAGRPVYFTGNTPDGSSGHAFVLDGYNKEGYFHVNWGWGGLSDGYFLTTALGPDVQGIGGADDAFTYGQYSYTHIEPNKDGSTYAKNYLLTTSGVFSASQSSATTTGNISFRLASSTYSYSLWKEKFDVGVGAYNEKGELAWSVSSFTTATLSAYSGFAGRTMSVAAPTSLANGTYKVYPIYRVNNGNGEWKKIAVAMGKAAYSIMVVDGTKLTFSSPTAYSLSAANISSKSSIRYSSTYNITAEISNTGDIEYYSTLKLQFYDGDTKVVESEECVVSVGCGETRTATFVGAAPGEAGDYTVKVIDNADKVIGEGAITIDRGDPSLTAKGNSTIDNPDMGTATYTSHISNSGNAFNGKLYLRLYRTDNGTAVLVTTYEKEVEIAAGAVGQDVVIEMSIPDPQPGQLYTCMLLWEKDGTMTEISQRYTRKSFTLSNVPLGVNDIVADGNRVFSVSSHDGMIEVNAPISGIVTVYDITGRMVTRRQVGAGLTTINVVKGVYLVRVANGAVTKLIVK